MKQKILIIFLVLASGCAGGAEENFTPAPVDIPQEYRAMKNPVAPSEASVKEGERLYSVYCSTCHGATGRGRELKVQGQVPPYLKILPQRTDGELYYILSMGLKINNQTVMLPYRDLLTEEEIWHIINYLRALEKTL